MKHLAVLRDAGLVVDRWEGRSRINSLNVVPIRQIYERWVSGYQDLWASQLTSLKRSLEGDAPKRTRRRPRS
jgi:DNA-binding transcriptional ArsR family regulator